ncbi:hypothetical protein ANO14919_031770 [Xylariales sp. No.14919]|nr:hypothetical protein ANO14919_031770 [Xylariales sp. No.14919]
MAGRQSNVWGLGQNEGGMNDSRGEIKHDYIYHFIRTVPLQRSDNQYSRLIHHWFTSR